jgi:hypothetical protein
MRSLSGYCPAVFGAGAAAQIRPEDIVTPERPKTATSTQVGRKSWTPKTPVDVVLEQIAKQEKKVVGLQKELEAEKSSLTKLLQAKKVLEAP